MAIDEARFEMFRRTPPGSSASTLASSLQSFESAIFLLALQRYPHALSTGVFALESALKSAPLTTKSTELKSLLKAARKVSPRMSTVDQSRVDDLRHTRNYIVHDGFVPRDDGPCAMLFLQAAVPLLSAAYLDFYSFNLFDGLLPEIAMQLRIAMDTCAASASSPDRDGTHFLVLLEHLVRRRLWEGSASVTSAGGIRRASEIGILWEEMSRRRDDLKRLLE